MHTRPFLRAVSKTDEKWADSQTYTPLTTLASCSSLEVKHKQNKGKNKGKPNKSKTEEKWTEHQTYTPLTTLEYNCKLQLFRGINKGKTKAKTILKQNR